MALITIQTAALVICLGLMIGQLFVGEKRPSHILFALFCGSIALSLTKELSSNTLGAYQYIIGMGACITCNGYWLFSRTLFRTERSISLHHLLFAGVIALLVMSNQGYLFATNSGLIEAQNSNLTKHILAELTVLLSSCILVLSFWEGCRGFKQADGKEKAQRILFLMTFGGAVAVSKVSQGVFAYSPLAQEFITSCIIIFVVLNSQVLLIWRGKSEHRQTYFSEKTRSTELSRPADESELAIKIKELIVDQTLFLQANLKIADIAQKLSVPEYRISNALRHNLAARNFNQYINQLRVEHAQHLLADSDKQAWTVLVVGLESGFASVGPFTRAFKTITGCTPHQYRQKLLD